MNTKDKNNMPRVTVGLLSFNQEKYIYDSLNSILNQDYPHLEIVISDDKSTDMTFQIIKDMVTKYTGPHRITLHQNQKNLGIGGNRSVAVNLAKTDLVVSADGDDISTPSRVSNLVQAWIDNNCEPLLITSDAYDMAVDGQIIAEKICSDIQNFHSIEDYFQNNVVFWGATNMYHKKIHDVFGHLNENVGAEDRAMLFRTLLIGKGLSIHKTLVYHRRGGAGASKPQSAYEKKQKLIKDAPKTIADIEQMFQDASKFNQGAIVKKYLQRRLSEAYLTLNLAKEKSLLGKLFLILKAKVIMEKRLDYFSI